MPGQVGQAVDQISLPALAVYGPNGKQIAAQMLALVHSRVTSGDGIRTHDPNLGKVVLRVLRRPGSSPHQRALATRSAPRESFVDLPIILAARLLAEV